MKTGREYFDMMDAETQAKFKANFALQYCTFDHYLKTQFKDFYHFISSCFVWEESIEGQGFWSQIANSQNP